MSSIGLAQVMTYGLAEISPKVRMARNLIVILLLLLAAFILFLHIRYGIKSENSSRAKFLHSSLSIVVSIVLVVALIRVWLITPSYGEEKAIRIAEREMYDPYSQFREVRWDRINHQWLVTFSDSEGDSCRTANLGKMLSYVTDSECRKVLKE